MIQKAINLSSCPRLCQDQEELGLMLARGVGKSPGECAQITRFALPIDEREGLGRSVQ